MKVFNEKPFEDKNMKLLVEWYEDKEKVLQFENQKQPQLQQTIALTTDAHENHLFIN